jgi:hypothetical protein
VQKDMVSEWKKQHPEFVVDPASFPYSSNPKAGAAMRYGYGVLPIFLDKMPPKVSDKPSSSSKKKKNKGQ